MKDVAIRIFNDTSRKFLEKLENNQAQDRFLGLVKLQITEIISVLKIDDIPVASGGGDSTSNTEMSKACSSNTLSTPKSSTSKIDLSKIKKFSPLVADGNKIRCTASWCTAKFSYKRSYDKHMLQFHRNIPIDPTVKDPPGTCELLTAGEPCRTPLGERAMTYHMEHIHGVHKPEKHFLYGFDTSSQIPSAVFVPDSQRYEAKKASTLNIPNAIVISQNVKQGSKMSNPTVSKPQNIGGSKNLKKGSTTTVDSDTPKHQRPVRQKRIKFLSSSSDSSGEKQLQEIESETLSLSAPKRIRKDESEELHGSRPKSSLSGAIYQELGGQISVQNNEPLSQQIPLDDLEEFNNSFDNNNVFEDADNNIFQESLTQSKPSENEEDIGSEKDDSYTVSPEPTKKNLSSQSSIDEDNKHSLIQSPVKSLDSKDRDSLESNSSDDESDYEEESNELSNIDVDYYEQYNASLVDNSFSEDRTDDVSQNTQEDDSDIEEGDGDLFTIIRRRNRDTRYQQRNIIIIPLHEKDDNKVFIEDFKTFLLKFSVTPENRKTPVVDRACLHLFIQDDSLLNYESQVNAAFNLESLRKFTSETFVNLKYPGDWIVDTAAENGNKGINRLKASVG